MPELFSDYSVDYAMAVFSGGERGVKGGWTILLSPVVNVTGDSCLQLTFGIIQGSSLTITLQGQYKVIIFNTGR